MARSQSKVMTAAEGKAMKKTLAIEAAAHAKTLKDITKAKSAAEDVKGLAIKAAIRGLTNAQKVYDTAVSAAAKTLAGAEKAKEAAVKAAEKAYEAEMKVIDKAEAAATKAAEKTGASLASITIADATKPAKAPKAAKTEEPATTT